MAGTGAAGLAFLATADVMARLALGIRTHLPYVAVFRGGASGFHGQVSTFPIVMGLGEDGGCE